MKFLKAIKNNIKRIITVLSITMIVVAILLFVYTVDNKKFNKPHKINNSEYFIHVYYLIMNKDEVPSDITMSKTFDPAYSEFPEGVLMTSSTYVPLTKKGEYLYADLDDFVDSGLIKDETDYVFTNFNNDGELIDGCEYNKDSNTIKVPISYYKNKSKDVPIQVEIQTLLNKKVFENYEIDVKLKKFITKNIKVKSNIGSLETIVKTGKFGPGELKKDNVHIYINNSSLELEKEFYDIDKDSVLIYMPAHLIRNLDIKIDYSLKNVFAGAPTDFTGDPNAIRGIKLSQPLDFNDFVGKEFELSIGTGNDGDVQYCVSGADCFIIGGEMEGWRHKSANWSYTYYEVPGQGWEAGNKTHYRSYLFTYRMRVSALLREIGASLEEPIQSVYDATDEDPPENTDWFAFFCMSHQGKIETTNGKLKFKITEQSRNSDNTSITVWIISENKYNNQDAAGVLRFYWDNREVGLGVRKTDGNGKQLVGLDVYAVNVANHNDVVGPVVTDGDGVAKFGNLDPDKKYVFYENCNDSFDYDNKTNVVFGSEPRDGKQPSYVECTYRDADHAYGGSGFTPTEDYKTIPVSGHTEMKNNHIVGLRVKKTDDSGTPKAIAGLSVYAKNMLDNSAAEYAVTDTNGVATFNNLNPNGKYKFYEACSSTVTYNNRQGKLSDLLIDCLYPDADHALDNNGNGYIPTKDYMTATMVSMRQTRYRGLCVIKTDDSNSPIPISGLSITAINRSNDTDIHTAQTDEDGIVCFDNLKDGAKYNVYEDCSDTVSYNGNTGTLDSLGINCSYPSSKPATNGGNGYTPTTDYRLDNGEYNPAKLIELQNFKDRYCAIAHKSKGPDKRDEKGVTIQLTIPAGMCRNYPNGHTFTKTTDGDGYASFVGLGSCSSPYRGYVEIPSSDPSHYSIVGSDREPIDIVKSTIKVLKNGVVYNGTTYNAGQTIKMNDADFETYSARGDVEELCLTTNQVLFENRDYVIKWKKIDRTLITSEDGEEMSGVKFTIRKAGANGTPTGEPIQVLETKRSYTDYNGVTHSCYKIPSTNDTGVLTTLLESDNDGMVCVFNFDRNDENYVVEEVATNYYDHQSKVLSPDVNFSSFDNENYYNYEYLIDWKKKECKNDKSTYSNGDLENAKFTVKDSSNNLVRTKPNKETVKDKNGISKSCYVVDLQHSSNNTNSTFISDANGYTCIVGLKKNETYTVVENEPPAYYTFSETDLAVPSKLYFDTGIKTMTQAPTEVKITKTTTELTSNVSDAEKRLIYEELQKLSFVVIDNQDNVLSFIYNSTSGRYEYVKALNDLTGRSVGLGEQSLRLLRGVDVATADLRNVNLDIIIDYLPAGVYTFRELSSISCGTTSGSSTGGSNCTCTDNTLTPYPTTAEEDSCSNMGYAHVGDIRFSVNNNSRSTLCGNGNQVTGSMTNKPTVVKFTKKDFYSYYNDVDTVKFENEEEIEAFDNIIFKVRKKSTANLSGISSIDSSVYEWFYKTKNGEYRHDVLHKCTREGQQVAGYTCTQNLHTERGDMKLTHLCKCEEYYIEEYEVPDGSVFILPKLEESYCADGYMKVNKDGKLECHPIKGIKVCDCDDDNPESSPPVKIEDLPTKQAFIKKDLKYNTIITDQRTTFELFLTTEEAEAAGRSCNPYDATSKARDCVQIYFSERTVLSDEADGSYSYRMHPNQSANDKVKELHVDPNTGKLIFRYLPSYINREYVLMETVAPKGYDLPTGEKSVTRFKVANDTVNVEVSNVPNKPSKAIIGKYDIASGKLIPGVKFRVYKVNNYDENLTAMMQSRSSVLEFKTIRDGSYEYRETFDTDTITTCIDKEGSLCSDISSTLVENTYANTDMGTQESTTTIQEGQALIQYLDTNTYYVIEEVEAPEGYKLPERESDRFTLFYIPESEEVTKETKIYNTETYFTFFKYDEFNRVKDGATFKLQKLNKDKIYEDVAVEDVSTEDTKMYRVLSTSENYDITTLNGQATIYRLTEGQYRIIETKAPEGYELPKKTYNVVTFLVDKKGHTYGQNIIANKKKTEHIEVVPEAEAELVVNIQTGKKVIKYGLIIAGILGLISLLIYIRKKVGK